jgi:hypothetical protein
MQKTNSSPEAKAEIEAMENLKKRAARQAAKRELAPEVYPIVECTVLPMGDGKISMGQHVAGLGTAHYEEGETFSVETPIAVALYRRGFVNFEGAKDIVAQFAAEKQAQAARDLAEKQEFDRVVGGAGG